MMVTERLARAALELHRMALAAAEARNLPSPATPREKNAKGASDPTAGTAMDPRRAAVADALDALNDAADMILADVLPGHRAALTDALNTWDGRK